MTKHKRNSSDNLHKHKYHYNHKATSDVKQWQISDNLPQNVKISDGIYNC